MSALRLVTAPTVEPVTVSEAKSQSRIDTSADDALIGLLITTAREYVELVCRPQLALITQTWECLLDDWPAWPTMELRPYPLQSVSSIKYTNSAGQEATVSANDYLVDVYSEPGRVRLLDSASWPSATLRELNGVAIRFVAGYGAAGSSVPAPLRQAILLLVAHWYENREAVTVGQGFTAVTAPMAVDALMRPWRREV